MHFRPTFFVFANNNAVCLGIFSTEDVALFRIIFAGCYCLTRAFFVRPNSRSVCGKQNVSLSMVLLAKRVRVSVLTTLELLMFMLNAKQALFLSCTLITITRFNNNLNQEQNLQYFKALDQRAKRKGQHL